MFSNPTEEGGRAELQAEHADYESTEQAQGLYGFLICALYFFGLLSGFVYLAAHTQLSVAIGAGLVLLLCCFCGVLVLWRYDERQRRETLPPQPHEESFTAPWRPTRSLSAP